MVVEGWRGEITTGQKETSEGNRYIHCFQCVCGDGFNGIYICQNLSNRVIYICIVHIMSIIPQQSCLKKAKIMVRKNTG